MLRKKTYPTIQRYFDEEINKETHISSPSNAFNKIIWNNKFVCIGKKPVFRNKISKNGIIKLSLYTSLGAHQAGAYPGFLSMKRLGVLLLPPGWDASPSQSYPTGWREALCE